jgi:cytochrome c-type biogenesis protein CcmH
MVLGVIFAVLALATAGILTLPLWRRPAAGPARAQFDLRVYRQQLTELERDQERGVLPADQAESARTEIHRRILAAEEGEGSAASQSRLQLPLILLLVIGIPAASGLIYWRLGAPDMPGKPFAARQSDPAFQMATMVDQLAAYLKTQPDGEGYRRLGQAYMSLRRYGDAANAFHQAQSLGVVDGPMLSSWGEALVLSQGGMVVPEARKILLLAYSMDRQSAPARFYLGMAQMQIGNFQKAVAIWRDLEKDSGPDAPWLETLKARIAEAGQQGKFDPASIAPEPPAPPSANDSAAAAIANQAPDQQAATIRSMVEGLAARLKDNPNDYDGWMRLARSYRVLGEVEKGKDAARQAIKLQPKAAEPRLALAQLQLGNAPEDKLPADFVATLRDVLTLEPDNITALYYIGAAEEAAGHKAEARKLFEKVLASMPPDQPERAELKMRLEALK